MTGPLEGDKAGRRNSTDVIKEFVDDAESYYEAEMVPGDPKFMALHDAIDRERVLIRMEEEKRADPHSSDPETVLRARLIEERIAQRSSSVQFYAAQLDFTQDLMIRAANRIVKESGENVLVARMMTVGEFEERLITKGFERDEERLRVF